MLNGETTVWALFVKKTKDPAPLVPTCMYTWRNWNLWVLFWKYKNLVQKFVTMLITRALEHSLSQQYVIGSIIFRGKKCLIGISGL